MALAQVLEEFYENLATVGVSAATGEGMDDFMKAVQGCAKDYEQHYLPELQRRQEVWLTLQRISLWTPLLCFTVTSSYCWSSI